MGNFTHQVAVLLAGCLIAAPICAVEKDGLKLTITQKEDDACSRGGGCVLIPRAVLLEMMRQKLEEAYEEGHKDGIAETCKGSV